MMIDCMQAMVYEECGLSYIYELSCDLTMLHLHGCISWMRGIPYRLFFDHSRQREREMVAQE